MQTTQSWGKEENQKYYEAELQKKIIYVPNLSFFLNALHMQSLRLPHEQEDANSTKPSGTTEKDIVRSFMRGVDVAYAILSPVRKEMKEKRELTGDTYEDCKIEITDFKSACDKLAWIYDLLDTIDMLNARLISMDLPDSDSIYNKDLEVEENDEPIKQPLPAPLNPADGKAVGEVVGKDQ